MENYSYFLKINNAHGNILADIRSEAKAYRRNYYKIMANGTLYIDEHIIQERIESIKWCKKDEKNCGLQLADFIPNPFNHYYSKNKI